MDEDPIMRELHQIRLDLLKKSDGDLGKLLEHATREAPRLLARFRQSAASPKPTSRRKHPSKAGRSSFRSANRNAV